jgi:xanthine dehydrogenase accessory factor
MKEIVGDVERWRRAGLRVAVARVVGVEGSGPRDPGATMVVSEAGEVAGSVSGGCVEGAVVTEALAAMAEGGARLRTYGYSDTEAFAVGLTCGGTIHVLGDPQLPAVYEELRDARGAHHGRRDLRRGRGPRRRHGHRGRRRCGLRHGRSRGLRHGRRHDLGPR